MPTPFFESSKKTLTRIKSMELEEQMKELIALMRQNFKLLDNSPVKVAPENSGLASTLSELRASLDESSQDKQIEAVTRILSQFLIDNKEDFVKNYQAMKSAGNNWDEEIKEYYFLLGLFSAALGITILLIGTLTLLIVLAATLHLSGNPLAFGMAMCVFGSLVSFLLTVALGICLQGGNEGLASKEAYNNEIETTVEEFRQAIQQIQHDLGTENKAAPDDLELSAANKLAG